MNTTYYDSLWRPFRYEDSGPDDTTLVTLTQYDALDRVIETDDLANSTVTRYKYDPSTGDLIDTLTTFDGNLSETISQTTGAYGAFNFSGAPYTGPAIVTTTSHNGQQTSVSATSLDGRNSWYANWNAGNPFIASETHTVIDSSSAGTWTTTTTASDGTQSVSYYVDDALVRTQQLSADTGSGRTLLAQTDYAYDDLWRTHTETTWTGTNGTASASITATYTYRDNGQVSRIDYSDGTYVENSGWTGVTDQPTAIHQRDGTTLTRQYNAKGQLIATSGGGATPVSMSTDNVAGTSTLTTYKDGNLGNNGTANAATTTWQVDPNSGRMTGKTYADSSSQTFTYNANGQLDTTTYGYTAGTYTNLEAFAYDPISHALTGETFNYATHGSGTGETRFNLALTYSHSGTTADMLTGIALNQTTGTTSNPSSTTLLSTIYGYDNAGRLGSVTGDASTTFGYDDGTGNRSSQTTQLSGDDIVTTNHYNAANGHLESIVTTKGSTIIYEEDLTYPSAGQAHYDQIARKQVTSLVVNGTASTTEHFYITYSYDALNQLTAETTYSGVYGDPDPTVLASETFAYDSLGNRTNLNAAGAANIDIMNQYLADANSHTLSYDARGNLTGTYDYAYTYDQLNRLTSATPTDHGKSKALYTYDYANRRTSETLYAWDSSAGDWSTTPSAQTTYLYGGQMLFAELDGLTGLMTKSYEWDPTKPNGVGGLLCITTYSGGTPSAKFRPVYDANANVTALVDLTDGSSTFGTVVANYSYTAFGVCTATGTYAEVCNFRFGGMYWQASANSYSDHDRDFQAPLNRFMQRDPSGESNSINRNAYCLNDPINKIDPSGLRPIKIHREMSEKAFNDQDAAGLFKGLSFDKAAFREGLVWGSIEPDLQYVPIPIGGNILDTVTRVQNWIENNSVVSYVLEATNDLKERATEFAGDAASVLIPVPYAIGVWFKNWWDDSNFVAPGMRLAHLDKTNIYRTHYGDNAWQHGMFTPALATTAAMQSKIVDYSAGVIEAFRAAIDKGDAKTAGYLLGVALHLLQDTYTASHVTRDGSGRIERFQDYTKQSPTLHANGNEDAGALGDDITSHLQPEWTNGVYVSEEFMKIAFDRTLKGNALKTKLQERFYQLAPAAVAGGSEKGYLPR